MAKKVYDNEQQISRLRNYNIVAGSAHAIQAIVLGYALTLLPTQVLYPVTIDYMAGPPGSPIPFERVDLFDINLGVGIVAFLGLSAFFHFLISTPLFFPRYSEGLRQSRNNFRWVEYALSSSIMIWLICQLNGVTDIAALAAIFAVNASMIMFGALQEKYERPGSKKFLPFVFGSMTGIVPWLIIAMYVIQPGSTNDAEVPGFVLGIVFSIFILFNTFAVNQALQYRQVGKWANYLRGERMYITLSLVAKTLLAWQIYSGAIVPALTA